MSNIFFSIDEIKFTILKYSQKICRLKQMECNIIVAHIRCKVIQKLMENGEHEIEKSALDSHQTLWEEMDKHF